MPWGLVKFILYENGYRTTVSQNWSVFIVDQKGLLLSFAIHLDSEKFLSANLEEYSTLDTGTS